MNTPTITHHGAVTGVTGSCHQYCTENIQLLIDCGLFQGAESNTPLDNFAFNPAEIDAIIVTHGHIDHVGRIPWLIAPGFDNPVLCSEPTAKLLPIILRDALEIQLGDHAAVVESILVKIESLLTPLPLNTWYSVSGSTRVRLQNAGHILGSAYVEVDSCIAKTSATGGSLKSHRTVTSYLEALLEKPETDILFVGYQAKGTLGSAIQQSKHEDMLKFGSQKLIRRAAVHTISGFSAHADQTDLLSFACNMDENPKEIRLVHGSDDAKKVFREKLTARLPEATVIIVS